MAGAHDGPQPRDIGALLHSQGIGAQTTNSAGDKKLEENIAEKALNLLLKPFGVNVSDAQNVFSSFKNPMSFLENPALKTGTGLAHQGFLGKLFAGSTVDPNSSIVHKNETATLAVNAPHVEAPSHNVSFQDLIGDSGSMGKYSVADVAGGPPTSHNAPIGDIGSNIRMMG